MSIVRDEEQQFLDVYLKAVSQYSASVKKMREVAGKNHDIEFIAALEEVRRVRTKAHDARLRFNAFLESKKTGGRIHTARIAS